MKGTFVKKTNSSYFRSYNNSFKEPTHKILNQHRIDSFADLEYLFPICVFAIRVPGPLIVQTLYLPINLLITLIAEDVSFCFHGNCCRSDCMNETCFNPIPHFDALKIFSCGKHCEKRRNCL